MPEEQYRGLKDAQEVWDKEVMRRPRSNPSSGASSSGSATQMISGANQVRITRVQSGALSASGKTSMLGRSAIGVGSIVATSSLLSSNTDAALGINEVRQVTDIGMMGFDVVKRVMGSSLQRDADSYAAGIGLKTFSSSERAKISEICAKSGIQTTFKSALTADEIKKINEACKARGLEEIRFEKLKGKQLEKFLNTEGAKYLHQKGYLGSSNLRGFGMQRQALAGRLKSGGNIPEFDKQLLKLQRKQGTASGLKGGQNRFKLMRIFTTITRDIKQCEAGQGMSFAVTSARRLAALAKASRRAIAGIAKSARLSAKMGFIMARKAAVATKAKTLNSVLDQMSRAAAAAGRKAEALKARSIKIRKAEFKDRLKKKVKAPFKKFFDRIKKRLKAALMRTRFGQAASAFFGRFSFLRRGIQKIFGGIAAFFSAISTIVTIVIGFLVVVLIAFVLIPLIFRITTSNMSTLESSSKRTELALKTIKECYSEQMQEIQGYSTEYSGNVTVSYEDKKNKDIYKAIEMTKEDIPETTNAAEILSMAMVYSDFNLEKLPEDEFVTYIKELYYGSHDITVSTNERQVFDGYTDEEHHVPKYRTVVDADVLLTTYYFDDIFDCGFSSTSEIMVVNANQAARAIYQFLSEKGLDDIHIAAILGIYYGESKDFDPTSVETIFDEPFKIGPKKKKAIAADFAIEAINPSYAATYSAIVKAGIGFGAWTDTRDMKPVGLNTLLRKYAKKHGGEWYDMNMQLGFFWDGMPEIPDTSYKKWHGRTRFESAKTLEAAATAYYQTRVNGWSTSNPVPAIRMNAARAYYKKILAGQLSAGSEKKDD